MKPIKHLFIQLSIQDGEREHIHNVITTTYEDDIQKEAEKYAEEFWGESYEEDGGYYAWGGEIHIKVAKVKQITEEQYNFLDELFYQDSYESI